MQNRSRNSEKVLRVGYPAHLTLMASRTPYMEDNEKEMLEYSTITEVCTTQAKHYLHQNVIAA